MTADKLTFRVRPGLAVHVEATSPRGEKVSAPFGAAFKAPEVTLTPEQVALHAHALEPTCKVGAAELEKYRFKRELMTPPEADYAALNAARRKQLIDELVDRIVAEVMSQQKSK